MTISKPFISPGKPVTFQLQRSSNKRTPSKSRVKFHFAVDDLFGGRKAFKPDVHA